MSALIKSVKKFVQFELRRAPVSLINIFESDRQGFIQAILISGRRLKKLSLLIEF